MRTIDELNAANAAPAIDRVARNRIGARWMIIVGLVLNMVALGLMLGIGYGGVDHRCISIAIAFIMMGCSITAGGVAIQRSIRIPLD